MQRGAFVLGLVAMLAIGCGSPTYSVLSQGEGVLPDAVIGDDDTMGTVVINPPMISITGPNNQLKMFGFQITGTGMSTSIVTMNLSSAGFEVLAPAACVGPAICNFVVPPLIQPTLDLVIQCTPMMGMPQSSTLQVQSNVGVPAMTIVDCNVAAGTPSFDAPASFGPLVADVGGMDSGTLFIQNNGTGNIEISIEISASDPDTARWTIDDNDCVSPGTCTVPQNSSKGIPLTFRPLAHGDASTSLTVSSVGLSSQLVTLNGTGRGADLRVTTPASFTHDFGTIGKGQTATLTVEMTNVGNQDLTVSPVVPTPVGPFAIPTPITPPISVLNGGIGVFDITCFSMNQLPEQTSVIPLNASPNTYTQNTTNVTVTCTIANTTLQVTNPLAFGELRTGDNPGQIPVTLSNPGPTSVNVTSISLSGAPAGLTLATPTPAVPMLLPVGSDITTMLTLATDEDLELVNVRLNVVVDSETLELPITGRVGTPAAVVLPRELVLGSVCVGTQINGQVTMTNTGTSTLRVTRPAMDSTKFVPLLIDPTDYPPPLGATLLPESQATIGVMPASTSAGMYTDTILWTVDVPTTFEIDVSLELRDEGPAVSPGQLEFGSIAIGEPPLMEQTVTLENCGPETVFVSYDRVVAASGGVIAWRLSPPSQARELAKDESMQIRVSFAPEVPGLHDASLPIDVDSSTETVRLLGDATGVLSEKTSFYACDCSGSLSGGRGGWTSWLIVGAFAFVIRRRRRVLRR